MKIYIGADHRGVELKAEVIELLSDLGHEVDDVGTYNSQESCDYPDIAEKVATKVAQEEGTRGILLCMSGIGHSIAANKVQGAYAALCYTKEAAALSRQHNNANILVIGSKFVSSEEMDAIVNTWLTTPFEGGRHESRVNKIKEIENKSFL